MSALHGHRWRKVFLKPLPTHWTILGVPFQWRCRRCALASNYKWKPEADTKDEAGLGCRERVASQVLES